MASSISLNECANDFTPSATSCSVTSCSEMPLAASASISAWAPGTSSWIVSGLDHAVIEQRVERGRRHRVDGVGADDV